MNKVAFAIAAHPDDIEFRMAGTMLLLAQAGWELHYMTIANGSLGSTQYSAARAARVRRRESKEAAKILGAHWHASLVEDLEILYELRTLRRLAAVVREVRPSIVLTHPPQDYMEDHVNAGRLAASAAFVRGMPNLKTLPPRPAYDADVAVYHCMPHGLCDPLRRPLVPPYYVNIASVIEAKCQALAAHRSQAAWLEESQKMARMTGQVEADARAVGKLSRKFKLAEGWWPRLHLGYGPKGMDPMREALGKRLHCRRSASDRTRSHDGG